MKRLALLVSVMLASVALGLADDTTKMATVKGTGYKQ